MNIQEIRNNFPQYNDMSDEDLVKGLHSKYYSDIPFDDFAGQVGFKPENQFARQLGLTTRGLAQAVNDLPNMVVDPFVNLYNLATDSNVPTFAQRQEQLYNDIGLPEPDNAAERIANTGMRVLGTAGAAGKLAKEVPNAAAQFFAANPAAQVTAGLSSTAGVEAAKEMGVENPYALLGIGMTTGMLPGAAGSVATTTGARSGLTQRSREVIGGKILNQFVTDKDKAIGNLSEFSVDKATGQPYQLIPGSQPMTGGASRDPGLAGLERSVRSFDQSNQIGNVVTNNNQARLNYFDKISGRNKVEYAKNKREEVGRSIREPALDNAAPIDIDAVRQGVDMVVVNAPKRQVVKDAVEWARGRIEDAQDGSARSLYQIRQDIQDARFGKYDKDGSPWSLAKGELGDVLTVIDNEIERVAPGMADYRRKFSATSRALDQMKLMGQTFNNATRGQTDLMGNEVLKASTLRNEVYRRVRDDPKTPLTRTQQRKLEKIIKDIDMGMASVAPGVKPPGSDTFKNMTFANIIGKTVGDYKPTGNKTMEIVTRPLAWLGNFTDDQVRQLLVEAMLDPQLAAQMMRKASAEEAKTFAAALKQKAIESNLGASRGAYE